MAGPPARAREILFCPGCGYDLDQARPRRVGDLYADPIGDTYWKGQAVHLTVSERLLLHSLLTCSDHDKGFFTPTLTIAERLDCNVSSIHVRISTMRAKFRQHDPDFNHIETGMGGGFRWTVTAVPRIASRARDNSVILYDNGEVKWRDRYRLFLHSRERGVQMHQFNILKALIDAQGAYVTNDRLVEITGAPHRTGPFISIKAIRTKFAAADPKTPIIEAKRQHGYRVVRTMDRANSGLGQ